MNKYTYSIKYIDKNNGKVGYTVLHEYGETEADAIDIVLFDRVEKSSFIGRLINIKLIDKEKVS